MIGILPNMIRSGLKRSESAHLYRVYSGDEIATMFPKLDVMISVQMDLTNLRYTKKRRTRYKYHLLNYTFKLAST